MMTSSETDGNVTDVDIGYYAVRVPSNPDRIASIIADVAETGDSDSMLQAVIWNPGLKSWRFDPPTAGYFIFNENAFDLRYEVDRATAEQIARESLSSELPDEETLLRLCIEGKSRWNIDDDPDGIDL